MTDKIANATIIVGMATFILCNVVYDFYQIKGFWYVGNSFAFVCYAYAINRLMKNITTKVLLAIVISQFLDEIFGDPTKVNWIEYLAFFGILLFFWINEKIKGKRSTKNE